MQLVDIRDACKSEREDNASRIREIADRVEAGEITECSIICNDVENNVYSLHLQFQDRWRLLGALEYAKAKVNES